MPDNVDNITIATSNRTKVDVETYQKTPRTPKTPLSAKSKKMFDLEGSNFMPSFETFWKQKSRIIQNDYFVGLSSYFDWHSIV